MERDKVSGITVGADPELFLTRNDWLVSAVGLIGGTKEAPAPLGRPGFAVQEDNVAVEFNIPPAKTLAEWCESIDWSIQKISSTVSKHGYGIRMAASGVFKDEELKSPQAQAMGCDADYNAWTKERNPRPVLVNPRMRACGGHVHVGWPHPKVVATNGCYDSFRTKVVRCMDLFHGIPSVLMDDDTVRKQIYGKAGAHRITPYGIEYRVLSNFWLTHPKYIKWVYEQVQRAYEWATMSETDSLFADGGPLEQRVPNTINFAIKNLAKELVKEYNLAVV